MKTIRELTPAEMKCVSGGALSIMEEIEKAFPGGVWIGNSYYPNGAPSSAPPGPYTT